jgi:hypothetical protein
MGSWIEAGKPSWGRIEKAGALAEQRAGAGVAGAGEGVVWAPNNIGRARNRRKTTILDLNSASPFVLNDKRIISA